MAFKKSYNSSERYKMSIPNGWYAACYSHEIRHNEIKPLSILNKEFVIFRSAKGKVSVLDAYCPHQGTHLGYGGKVVNDCIVCPFHRWRFNEEGKCVEVPYATKVPVLDRNCLISLPTLENDGMVVVYFHKENYKPDFHLPNFATELPNDTWTKPKHTKFLLNTHIHEMGENGFDVAHFRPVHGSEENNITIKSGPTDKVMKFRLDLVYPGAGMGLLLPKINVHADWSCYGLGMFSNFVTVDKFPVVISQHFYFTPQNDGQIAVRFSIRVNKHSLPGNALAKWLQKKLINYKNKKMVLQNFNQDRPIWENKIYRPKPVLCDGDGPIFHFRRWAQQFYSSNGPLDCSV